MKRLISLGEGKHPGRRPPWVPALCMRQVLGSVLPSDLWDGVHPGVVAPCTRKKSPARTPEGGSAIRTRSNMPPPLIPRRESAGTRLHSGKPCSWQCISAGNYAPALKGRRPSACDDKQTASACRQEAACTARRAAGLTWQSVALTPAEPSHTHLFQAAET